MFVSPAEPAKLRAGRKVSTLCEQRGADFLFPAHGKWVGIQRKEIQDFISSVQDGRLQKELVQLQVCTHRVLIIEGKIQWTTDGVMMGKGYGRPWTRKQWRGITWGIGNRGILVEYTDDIQDTITTLDWLEQWYLKDNHNSLDRRPGPVSLWGKPSNSDYQRHLVMGLPGVGPELADRIVRTFNGVPFGWNIEQGDLEKVEGIGKVKAKKIYECLLRMESGDGGRG